MSDTRDDLIRTLRGSSLKDRIEQSGRMIGEMCAQGRCPKMSIPVRWTDEDFYISQTLADADADLAAMTAERDEARDIVRGCDKALVAATGPKNMLADDDVLPLRITSLGEAYRVASKRGDEAQADCCEMARSIGMAFDLDRMAAEGNDEQKAAVTLARKYSQEEGKG